jgi:hypothetical protein
MQSINERFVEFIIRFLGGGDCHQFEFDLFADYLRDAGVPF